MGWIITKKDIPDISLGAKFLSCGGGGDTKTVEYLLLSCMNDSDLIVVKTAIEMESEWIVPVAMVGSTVLLNEDLPSGIEPAQTVKLYEAVTRQHADAVISMEIGGINALIPLLVAFERNLPVIDGDGMGRAFPKLEMTTYFNSYISVLPLAAYSNVETLVAANQQQFAEVYDSFIFNHKGYGYIACLGMAGYQMKALMIPGTLKLARNIGRALSNGSIEEKVDSLRSLFSNSVYGELQVCFLGRILTIRRWFEEKILVGSCQIAGQFSFAGRNALLYFQNEFLSVRLSGEESHTTPDLIILLNYENGLPLSVSDIHEGVFILVLIVPAPSIFHTKDMFKLVGPKSFGIPNEFYSVHEEVGGLLDEDRH